jgi:hypothetical protein
LRKPLVVSPEALRRLRAVLARPAIFVKIVFAVEAFHALHAFGLWIGKLKPSLSNVPADLRILFRDRLKACASRLSERTMRWKGTQTGVMTESEMTLTCGWRQQALRMNEPFKFCPRCGEFVPATAEIFFVF